MRLLISIIFLLSIECRAEYRAFELNIENVDKGTSRKAVGVLDHLQYKTFYDVKKNEKVTIAATWRCKGNTSGFKPVCPKPDTDSSKSTKPKVG